MKNKALFLVFITLLSSTFLVNADGTESSSSGSTSTGNTIKLRVTNNLATAKNELKQSIAQRKQERVEFMETQKAKLQEVLQNRKEFKEGYQNEAKVFSGITDEQKQELEELRDANKTATQEILEKLKATDLTLEQREELKAQLQELNDNLYEDLKALFEGDENILAYLEAREQLREKNQELREEAKKAREEYRQGRDEQVEAQKEYYLNKLALSIPKVSDDKLESIKKQAQNMLDKIETNTKISDEKKEELAAKIISLIEILDEEINSRGALEEEINVDDILTQE